jgi:hypothetical protein
MLPKPAANGQKYVRPGDEFQGDSYFMEMVKTNQVRLVRTLITPEQERGTKMNEEKLICDQPDIVTTQGKVEHVVVTEKKPLNESGKKQEATSQPEVLINEDPLAGVDILG